MITSLEDELMDKGRQRIEVVREPFPTVINSHIKIPKGIYEIMNAVYIGFNGVLEIEPGTIMNFSEDAGISSGSGILNATGTKENPIKFTASGKKWKGIHGEFSGQQNQGYTLFQYCDISKASGMGGAFFFWGSNIKILHCTIHHNNSPVDGGAIQMDNCQQSAEIVGNYIHHNSSDHDGGAIKLFNSNAAIKNNWLLHNRSKLGHGGAISAGSSNQLLIENNHIEWNISEEYGGGISLYKTNAIIRNNKIVSNKVMKHYGGGLYIYNGCVDILSNSISSNRTAKYGYGGGIYLFGSISTIKENSFWFNSSGWGGALYLVNSSNLIDNRFFFNSCGKNNNGGAIYDNNHDSRINSGNRFFMNSPDSKYPK